MFYERHSGPTVYPLLFGEKFTYGPPSDETAGAVVLSKKDDYIFARAGVYRQEDETAVMICSNNISTTWDARTGMIKTMSVQPMIKVYPPGLPIMTLSFETMEPFLSVQRPVSADEFNTVENGLIYDGRLETGVMMEYGKDAAIASHFIRTPLCVRLEWEQHENRIVVESKPGVIEWVRYRQVIDPTTVVELFRSPRVLDPKWRDELTDKVHKLRYQIIESNGF